MQSLSPLFIPLHQVTKTTPQNDSTAVHSSMRAHAVCTNGVPTRLTRLLHEAGDLSTRRAVGSVQIVKT